jgi:hypothetical protein
MIRYTGDAGGCVRDSREQETNSAMLGAGAVRALVLVRLDLGAGASARAAETNPTPGRPHVLHGRTRTARALQTNPSPRDPENPTDGAHERTQGHRMHEPTRAARENTTSPTRAGPGPMRTHEPTRPQFRTNPGPAGSWASRLTRAKLSWRRGNRRPTALSDDDWAGRTAAMRFDILRKS